MLLWWRFKVWVVGRGWNFGERCVLLYLCGFFSLSLCLGGWVFLNGFEGVRRVWYDVDFWSDWLV